MENSKDCNTTLGNNKEQEKIIGSEEHHLKHQQNKGEYLDNLGA